jgi:hypothetical protein
MLFPGNNKPETIAERAPLAVENALIPSGINLFSNVKGSAPPGIKSRKEQPNDHYQT